MKLAAYKIVLVEVELLYLINASQSAIYTITAHLIIHFVLKRADNVENGRMHAKPDLRIIGKKEI